MHITNGLPDSLPGSLRLNLVLNGIWRVKAQQPKVKIPVTPLVLHRLRKVFLSTQADLNKVMMWVACCVGSYGFLWTAEFTESLTLSATLPPKMWQLTANLPFTAAD